MRYSSATLSDSKLPIEDQKKVSQWMKFGTGFLVYLGAPGCGKTHFCHAIFNDSEKIERYKYKRLWKESDFFSRLRSSLSLGDYNSEMKFMVDDDLVIYDDLGSVGHNEWRNEVIFSFIDFRYQYAKPTVITSNLPENEILNKIGSRVHSRLFAKENTILDFGKIDFRKHADLLA